jgi:regulator of ribosome biosynthesis
MTERNINEKFNVTCDLGHLLVYDNQPFNKDFINEEDIEKRAKSNLKYCFSELFKLVGTQRGEDDEKRDFDKPEDNVQLPKPETILPRAKPIPKPKALTKWEKYRAEKGIQPREKRSRMVYSETAGDWVPRWGKGSAKKIEENAEWAIEEKPGMEGKDPFALRKQQKDLIKMKQNKREMKNAERRNKSNDKGEKNSQPNDKLPKINKKIHQQKNEKDKLKKDKKGLEKTLETGKIGI